MAQRTAFELTTVVLSQEVREVAAMHTFTWSKSMLGMEPWLFSTPGWGWLGSLDSLVKREERGRNLKIVTGWGDCFFLEHM